MFCSKYHRIVTITEEIVDDEGNIISTKTKKKVFEVVNDPDFLYPRWKIPSKNDKIMDEEFFEACYSTEDTTTRYDQLYLPKIVKQAYWERKGVIHG